MAMMSFRVDADEAAAAHRWAALLGIATSELLRDAAAALEQPLTNVDSALAQIADWGPAEDWADWADAAG
jgi:hypothetical protein